VSNQVQDKDSRKYRLIFEESPDLLIQIDTKGTIIDINRKIFEISGYKPEEMIGRTIYSLTNILTQNSLKLITENYS